MILAAVIPHFQTPDETVRCLAALRDSRRRPDWIVVVDNGSAPPFQPPSGVTLIRSETNLGFSGGCNLGIRRALTERAEAVLLLNSDTEITPDCLGRLEGALIGRVAIVGPAVVDMSPGAEIESLGVRLSPGSGRMRNLRTEGAVDAVVGTCMLVRREVFQQAGLFDERFFYGFEDLELCLRARAHGFETAVLPEAKVRHQLAGTIGRASADRLYYAARNHLLTARLRLPPSLARPSAIVALNLAYALITSKAPRIAGVRAVLEGVADHLRGRYGPRRR